MVACVLCVCMICIQWLQCLCLRVLISVDGKLTPLAPMLGSSPLLPPQPQEAELRIQPANAAQHPKVTHSRSRASALLPIQPLKPNQHKVLFIFSCPRDWKQNLEQQRNASVIRMTKYIQQCLSTLCEVDVTDVI